MSFLPPFRNFILLIFCFSLVTLSAQDALSPAFFTQQEKIKQNPESALPSTLALQASRAKLTEQNQAEFTFLVGYNYYLLQNYLLTAKYFETAIATPGLPLLQQSQAYNYLGIAYEYLNKVQKSIENYLNALSLSERINNKEEMARNMINLGLAYGKINNFELAENYLNRSLVFSKELKDTLKIGLYYQNIGHLFYNKSNFDSSLHYNREAIRIFDKINHRSGSLQCLFNIALIKEERFEYYAAIHSYSEILKLADPTFDKATIANCLLMIGRAYANLENKNEAERYTDSAIQLIEKENLHFLQEQIVINRLYLSKNDPIAFTKNMGEFIRIKEALQQDEFNEKIAEMQTLYDYESKERQIEKANAALKSANIRNWIVIIGVLITVMLISILLIAKKQIGKIRHVLFEKNKEISKLSPQPEDYLKSLETKEDDVHSRLFKDILQLIEKREHINNPELSLRDIAKKLASNELYVSQAINKIAGKNFNRFLNEFRIDEAKKLLVHSKNKDKNMEEIAHMSGFTNANTFFRQFKEQTGLTPTQYKNMN